MSNIAGLYEPKNCTDLHRGLSDFRRIFLGAIEAGCEHAQIGIVTLAATGLYLAHYEVGDKSPASAARTRPCGHLRRGAHRRHSHGSTALTLVERR
jgi:hypothetical protein